MKRIIVLAFAIAVLAGFPELSGVAQAQSPKSSQAGPAKIGLIDMAQVFKNYEKFKSLREDLKAEIVQSDQKAKGMARQIQALQAEMKKFKEGTPGYLTREKKLAKLASEFETFRKVEQRKFLRREADIYKTVYLEVTDAVRKYAEYYQYALVIRFNSRGVETVANPAEVIKSMNRQVVYHRNENNITKPVLDYLNRSYNSSKKSAPPRSAQSSSKKRN